MSFNTPMPAYDPNDPFNLPIIPDPLDDSAIQPNLGDFSLDNLEGTPPSSHTTPGTPLAGALLTHFNFMAEALNLTPEQKSMAQRACEVPGEHERYIVLTTLLIAAAHRPATAVQLPTTPAHAQAQVFVPSDFLRDYLRRTAWVAICDPVRESYTATHTNGDIIQLSLERAVVHALSNESDAFHQEFLPAGFGSKVATVSSPMVMTVIREQIKYARQNLRSILLMRVTGANGGNQSLLTLKEIIGRIIRSSQPVHLHSPDQEIWDTVSMRYKMRFAFLRMLTLHCKKFPDENVRNTQWTAIDSLLRDLRSQAPIYQQAFYSLILSEDARLFNGQPGSTWNLLQADEDFSMPTVAQIEAQVTYLSSVIANNQMQA